MSERGVMPDRAELIEITLCSNGTLIGYVLSYVQYFGPTIVQAAIWGLSLKNRDPFIFVISNVYTWLLYYILIIIRDLLVESTRPFYVSDCERSFAVPDAWWIVSVSFLSTMMLCSLIYRKRTAWRLLTIFIITLGLMMYIVAPLVNGYMFVWQFVVNLVITILIVAAVNIVIYLCVVDLFIHLSEYQLFVTLGFELCFLREWAEDHLHNNSDDDDDDDTRKPDPRLKNKKRKKEKKEKNKRNKKILRFFDDDEESAYGGGGGIDSEGQQQLILDDKHIELEHRSYHY